MGGMWTLLLLAGSSMQVWEVCQQGVVPSVLPPWFIVLACW